MTQEQINTAPTQGLLIITAILTVLPLAPLIKHFLTAIIFGCWNFDLVISSVPQHYSPGLFLRLFVLLLPAIVHDTGIDLTNLPMATV